MRFHCDRQSQYGTCARVSLPGRTEEATRAQAVRDGWLIGKEQHLCPACSGAHLRKTKPEKPRRIR